MKIKKIFKIILNLFIAFLGLFFLLGSIALFSEGTTDGGIVFCIIALILLFFPVKLLIEIGTNHSKVIKERIQQLKEYEAERGIIKIAKNVSVIEKEKIIVLNNNEYSYKEILGAELIEDGNSVTTTTGKKKASVGKALVGGAIFGGVGAIVGGNSGKVNSKSIETQYCTNLKVKITINKISNPCEFINLIEYRTDKESSKYKNSFEDAQKILSVIDIIISNN